MREQVQRLVGQYTSASASSLTTPHRLLEKVIDIEVSAHTPSPTVDPSVRCILIGHSMGGIVAADTLLSITSDQPLDSSSSLDESSVLNTLMFPYIQGVLAFDTPYLGISPGVVAHSGETHYKTATTAWTQLGGLAGSLWGGQTAGNAQFKAAEAAKKPVAALPAPPTNEELKAASPWERWSKVALYAGAATAVAAAGSAAYYKRDTITESFGFIGSHLAFINCLMRPEELKKRVARIVKVNRELSVGWANLYTRLGQKAQNKDGSSVGKVLGGLRTFCNLPVKGGEVERGGYWREAVNDGATDETWAHMCEYRTSSCSGGVNRV
jgi:hypothetical protein